LLQEVSQPSHYQNESQSFGEVGFFGSEQLVKPANPIILALDYDNLSDVHELLEIVHPHIGMVKIGLELFTACGTSALAISKFYGLPIFLDLKLHDIPRTVEKTIKVLCDKLSAYPGPHFLSVHCLGGQEMCQRAWQAAQGSNVEIVGITLLTSLSTTDLRSFGMGNYHLEERAVDLADVAWKGKAQLWSKPDGINHFVCAPSCLMSMRRYYDMPGEVVLITPGIRGENDPVDDHKQSQTAAWALQRGADWLVIGRPITQAADPLKVAVDLKEQINNYR
jgi:orotidine-5'-phosphate decarboxylase